MLTLGSAVCELLLSSVPFQACWPSPLLTLQRVSCCCPWYPFKPINQANPWLCREWVLLSLAPCQIYWSTLPLALQEVSCCCSSWHMSKPADQAYPSLCRMWVAAVPSIMSSLFTRFTLDSAGSELLLTLALCQACWPSPPLALQLVSCCCSWHLFKPAD